MLNEDGSGLYKYDIFGFAPKAINQPIQIEWGFLRNAKGGIVKFDREYGHSSLSYSKVQGRPVFKGVESRYY